MTPTRKRRLIAVILIVAGVGIAATIASYSLQQNLLYFQSPSDLAQQPIPPELDDLVAACLEKERDARPESIMAVKEVLDRIAEANRWTQKDAKSAWGALHQSPEASR